MRITREMAIGGLSALIFLVILYFFFELLILASQPFKWVGGFLG